MQKCEKPPGTFHGVPRSTGTPRKAPSQSQNQLAALLVVAPSVSGAAKAWKLQSVALVLYANRQAIPIGFSRKETEAKGAKRENAAFPTSMTVPADAAERIRQRDARKPLTRARQTGGAHGREKRRGRSNRSGSKFHGAFQAVFFFFHNGVLLITAAGPESFAVLRLPRRRNNEKRVRNPSRIHTRIARAYTWQWRCTIPDGLRQTYFHPQKERR